jgi:hypothetical protein
MKQPRKTAPFIPEGFEVFAGENGVAIVIEHSPENLIMPLSHECAAGLIKHLVHALSRTAPELLLSMAATPDKS